MLGHPLKGPLLSLAAESCVLWKEGCGSKASRTRRKTSLHGPLRPKALPLAHTTWEADIATPTLKTGMLR